MRETRRRVILSPPIDLSEYYKEYCWWKSSLQELIPPSSRAWRLLQQQQQSSSSRYITRPVGAAAAAARDIECLIVHALLLAQFLTSFLWSSYHHLHKMYLYTYVCACGVERESVQTTTCAHPLPYSPWIALNVVTSVNLGISSSVYLRSFFLLSLYRPHIPTANTKPTAMGFSEELEPQKKKKELWRITRSVIINVRDHHTSVVTMMMTAKT